MRARRIEHAGGEVAGLARRGAEAGAHQRLRLLLDDRDQPVPHDLLADWRAARSVAVEDLRCEVHASYLRVSTMSPRRVDARVEARRRQRSSSRPRRSTPGPARHRRARGRRAHRVRQRPACPVGRIDDVTSRPCRAACGPAASAATVAPRVAGADSRKVQFRTSTSRAGMMRPNWLRVIALEQRLQTWRRLSARRRSGSTIASSWPWPR